MNGRSRRRVVSLLLLILALAVLVGIVLLRPPDWWTPIQSDDVVASPIGERFENACINEAHRVRAGDQPWAVRVRDDDVNAWLATRLPRWMEHAGATGIVIAQVRFREGAIDIAADVPEVPSVAIVTIVPSLTNDELAADRVSVAIGHLPLPFAQRMVIEPLMHLLGGDDAPYEFKLAAAILNGKGISAEFKLGDGRTLRLRDLELHEGEMLLEFETKVQSKR